MDTISRYIRDTIRGQYWEISITERTNGNVIFTKTHLKKNGGSIIKETERKVSKDFADKYKAANKNYHVETYTSNP